MGVLRKLVAVTGYGSLTGAGALAFYTRKSKLLPLPENDYLTNSTIYTRLNHHANPAMTDVVVRQEPLANINPKYLTPEGKLTERFCAGVWSTAAFSIQRAYLERKWRAQSPQQLWDTKALKESDYPVGTQFVDHFEVVSKTPQSIIVRCGDSPRVQQPRASDGLFEMVALPDKDTGMVEFQLKGAFFDSETKSNDPHHPVPYWIEFPHRWYTKLLMESAVRSLTK